MAELVAGGDHCDRVPSAALGAWPAQGWLPAGPWSRACRLASSSARSARSGSAGCPTSHAARCRCRSRCRRSPRSGSAAGPAPGPRPDPAGSSREPSQWLRDGQPWQQGWLGSGVGAAARRCPPGVNRHRQRWRSTPAFGAVSGMVGMVAFRPPRKARLLPGVPCHALLWSGKPQVKLGVLGSTTLRIWYYHGRRWGTVAAYQSATVRPWS